MRGHYACLPACLWFLDTWEVSLEKKPQKEEKKRGFQADLYAQ
jgi:hypothetical protein